jgi:hypothetical protein
MCHRNGKHRNPEDSCRNMQPRVNMMGVSGYGFFFCLLAFHARSARGRVLTGPWMTPPTAGAMKIERGVVYNPTIHHGYCLLEKNHHPGHRQGHERRPLPPVPYKSSGGLCSILYLYLKRFKCRLVSVCLSVCLSVCKEFLLK